jgi:hypothetical protein
MKPGRKVTPLIKSKEFKPASVPVADGDVVFVRDSLTKSRSKPDAPPVPPEILLSSLIVMDCMVLSPLVERFRE